MNRFFRILKEFLIVRLVIGTKMQSLSKIYIMKL